MCCFIIKLNLFVFLQAFQLIDSNKDGLIDKNDLRATFDSLGKEKIILKFKEIWMNLRTSSM